MHLQDAWVVDQQDKGTLQQIGYEPPTSTVFTYAAQTSYNFTATSTVIDKCASQSWYVNVSITNGKASYEASDNCPTLTPNFKFIGSSGS